MHAVGVCDRCKSIVEPRISTQWFMKMKPLAEPAEKVVRDGLIEVVPDNQRTILLNWLENIRDWCISRQLWWGHRIPIWHCADCKEMVPATDSRVEIVEGHARAGKRSHEMSEVRRGKTHAGYRRAGHLVQLRPVAVLHARLARRHRRSAHLLSHQPADQRLRHSVFLGCPHDHDGPAPHRRQASRAIEFRSAASICIRSCAPPKAPRCPRPRARVSTRCN